MTTKTCRMCGIEKDLTEFPKRKDTRDKHYSNCKTCEAKYDQEYYLKSKNKERHSIITAAHYVTHKEKVANGALVRLYGITTEEKMEMIIRQESSCAVCGNKFISNKDAHVDHNHITKNVRGILCRKCNMAIGLIGDNIHTANKLVQYLEKENDGNRENAS